MIILKLFFMFVFFYRDAGEGMLVFYFVFLEDINFKVFVFVFNWVVIIVELSIMLFRNKVNI